MAWTAPRQFPSNGFIADDVNENTTLLDARIAELEEALAELDRHKQPQPTAGAVVLGATAAAVELQRPVSRRSLLFPWRKR